MNKSNENLKQAGLKATLPRIAILNLLETATNRHMSVDEMHRELIKDGEDIGLATVYRVLTQFENAGLVMRHNFDNGHSVFELSTEDHHDHLRCLTCGQIFEFLDENLEARQQTIADKLGFVIRDHSMILYGACQRTNCEHRQQKLRR